jgi:hypothetical protein
VLLHEDALWAAMDGWVRSLPSATFDELLPLVRRAFSMFSDPERRAMGEKAKRLGAGSSGVSRADARDESIDLDRGGRVLPVLARIIGAP